MEIPNRFKLLFFIALLPFGSGYSYDFAGSIGAGPGETLQTRFNNNNNDYRLQTNSSSSSSPSSTIYTHATNQALYFCYSFPNVFLSVAAGVIIDSFIGLRRSTVIFSLIGTVGAVLFVLAAHFTNLPLLLFSRTVLGFGNEAVVVAMGAFISKHFKAGKLSGMALAFGFAQSMQRVAGALNFAISPRLAESYGLDYALLGGVVANIVSFFGILLVLFLDSKWSEGGQQQQAQNQKKQQQQQQQQQEKKQKESCFSCCSVRKWADGLTTKFWALMITCCCVYCVIFPFVGTGKNLFESVLGLSAIESGQSMSIYQILLAVGQPLTGIVVDRMGRLSLVLLFSSIASLIGVIVGLNLGESFHGGSSSLAVAGSIILCFVFSVSFVCAAATTRASVPLVIRGPQFTGRAFGVMAALIAGSTSVMRIVSGVVLDSSSVSSSSSNPENSRKNSSLSTPLFLFLADNNNSGSTSDEAPLPSPHAFELLFYVFLGIAICGIGAAIVLNLVDAGIVCSSSTSSSAGVLLESAESRKRRRAAAEENEKKSLLVHASESKNPSRLNAEDEDGDEDNDAVETQSGDYAAVASPSSPAQQDKHKLRPRRHNQSTIISNHYNYSTIVSVDSVGVNVCFIDAEDNQTCGDDEEVKIFGVDENDDSVSNRRQ